MVKKTVGSGSGSGVCCRAMLEKSLDTNNWRSSSPISRLHCTPFLLGHSPGKTWRLSAVSRFRSSRLEDIGGINGLQVVNSGELHSPKLGLVESI